MAKKEKPGPPEPPSAPGWMVTYGDLMSLLLTFFVIIVSFSSIEIDKFKAAVGSMRGALQPWNPKPGGTQFRKSIHLKMSDSNILDNAVEEILDILDEEGLDEEVEVQQSGGGIRIVFSDPVLFDSGRDILKDQAKSLMEKLVSVALKVNAKEVLIEGHTDDTPINTAQFPSNWELSAGRALTVLKFFQGKGYPPEKLVAVGYGQYHPRKKLPMNASLAEKGANRRVEIYLNLASESESLFPHSSFSEDVTGWGD